MKDLVEQLKKMKTSKNAGAVSLSKKKDGKLALLKAIDCIGSQNIVEVQKNEKISATASAYIKWILSDFISKPLTAGIAVFVLLVGGSLTTVNAASNSLPGDTLYRVKLVTERAKLSFASQESKTILHTEFARNRLYEAERLRVDSNPDSANLVLKTMNAFQKEVESASENLRQLKESGSSETVKVATELDQQITLLSDSIDVITKDDVNTDDLEKAQEITKTASNDAVDVMLEDHENNSSETSGTNLQLSFKNEVNDINNSMTYALGRLSVIKNAYNKNSDIADNFFFTLDDVTVEEHTISLVQDQIANAMDNLTSGAYRSSFDILRDAENNLNKSQDKINKMEIEIVTAINEKNAEAEKVDNSDTASEEISAQNEELINNSPDEVVNSE